MEETESNPTAKDALERADRCHLTVDMDDTLFIERLQERFCELERSHERCFLFVFHENEKDRIQSSIDVAVYRVESPKEV